MKEKKDIFDEVKELISEGQEEIFIEKKIVYDKLTNQASIKIPKSFALKAGLNENTEFNLVFNPTEKTFEKINKSKFVIYLKGEKDGEKKTGA